MPSRGQRYLDTTFWNLGERFGPSRHMSVASGRNAFRRMSPSMISQTRRSVFDFFYLLGDERGLVVTPSTIPHWAARFSFSRIPVQKDFISLDSLSSYTSI